MLNVGRFPHPFQPLCEPVEELMSPIRYAVWSLHAKKCLSDTSLSKIAELARFLQELYAVADLDTPAQALVPDPQEGRFFSASSLPGRFFVSVYERSSRFDDSWRIQATQNVMKRIHSLYRRLLEDIRGYNDIVRASFSKRMYGQSVEEISLKRAACALACWSSATGPFFKAVKQQSQAFQELLHIGFTAHESIETPFGGTVQIRESYCYQKISDFEGYLGYQLPLKALYRVATCNSLNTEDKKAFEYFAKTIDRKSSVINIRRLDKYLRILVELFQKNLKENHPLLLTNIVGVLAGKIPSVFLQRDPHHVGWRQRLQPGMALNCNGKEVILGPQLGPKAAALDNNLVFTIANDPTIVAVIGINRLSCLLKSYFAEKVSYGIRHANFIDIADDGSFSLVERLQTGFKDHKWSSSNKVISEEDAVYLHPIICSIRWFIAQKKASLYFSPEYLMYDVDNMLKCVRYTIPTSFLFMDMEKTITDFADGNRVIFAYLMVNSNMLKHGDAQYFRKIVSLMCKGKDPEPEVRSQVMNITDSRLVDHAKKLICEIENIRAGCLESLRDRYGPLPVNMEASINETLWRFYEESCGISSLPPGLKEGIVTALLDELSKNT